MALPPLYNLAPLASIATVGLLLALAPLGWVWWRSRGAPASRLRLLTVLTLFITFDLVLFGAFTRLTDSGLGCPDWPGCYGSSSPVGAVDHIAAAQALMPTGPVTHLKAWIEMLHRYVATAVGALILILAVASWLAARRRERVISPWWATLTLVWVCLQGAFGALTVTMKLYPAIVSLHLLGGMGLLVLLAAQSQAYERRPLVLPPRLHLAVGIVAGLVVLQIALGAWVSTNYAVLACTDFPTCHGSWWPTMDFAEGFHIWRPLGIAGTGGYLPFAALTAIHYAHRLGAYVVLAALALLAWRLHASGRAELRPWARICVALAVWQLATGLGNVLLGWPLLAAVAHTGGAAALVIALTVLLARAHQAGLPAAALVPQRLSASAAS